MDSYFSSHGIIISDFQPSHFFILVIYLPIQYQESPVKIRLFLAERIESKISARDSFL